MNQSADKIASVAIVGGTHGNELTGVYAIKHWKDNESFKSYPELQIETLLANEAAIKNNKRYLDKDLNRCFKQDELNDLNQNNKEQQLANQINQYLGPKGRSRVDFIIDLHTSTANMQTNIVLIKMDEFHLKLAAYLTLKLPDLVITSESNLMADHHFLCSISPKGIVVEIGPIAQGSLDSNIFEKNNLALKHSLDFVCLYNKNQLPVLGDKLRIMSYFSKIHFPVDQNNQINAMIHPSLIGKDYSIIRDGEHLFRDFSGNDINYQGETAHIAFVNEAAYYDQQIAMCLCQPIDYCLNTFKRITATN